MDINSRRARAVCDVTSHNAKLKLRRGICIAGWSDLARDSHLPRARYIGLCSHSHRCGIPSVCYYYISSQQRNDLINRSPSPIPPVRNLEIFSKVCLCVCVYERQDESEDRAEVRYGDRFHHAARCGPFLLPPLPSLGLISSSCSSLNNAPRSLFLPRGPQTHSSSSSSSSTFFSSLRIPWPRCGIHVVVMRYTYRGTA